MASLSLVFHLAVNIMSLPESTATGLSPGGFYPSPPTSPRPAPRDKGLAGKNAGKSTETLETVAIVQEEPKIEKPKIVPPVKRPTTPTGPTPVSDTDVPAVGKDTQIPPLDVWKTALSLDEKKCGAKTKYGKDCDRCGNKVSAKKTDKIEAVIEALRQPGLSDQEVDTQLDNLAKLVHCHFHDDPPRRQARVAEWLAVLPGTPHHPTLERRLRNILGGAVPTKCTSLKKDQKPCGNSVSRADQYYCEKTIRKMLQMATELGDGGDDDDEETDTLADLAVVLRYHMICSTHHRWPQGYQASWTVAINKFRAACQNEWNHLESKKKQQQKTSSQQKTTDVPKTPEKKRATTIHENSIVGAVLTPPPTPESRKARSKSPATYWDRGYDTSAFDVLGKNDTTDGDVQPHDMVRTVAQELLNAEKKLSDNEVNDGFVYVYTVPGNTGFVKVGFTTRDVKERHNEWTKDCNRDSTFLYPAAAAAVAATKKVRHAQRVERLVHAELMEQRVRIYCERCGKQHIEWFEVDADVAIASVRKWSLWMAGEPYEERVTREGSKWYLKETEKKRLGDVPAFLKELQEAVEAGETAK